MCLAPQNVLHNRDGQKYSESIVEAQREALVGHMLSWIDTIFISTNRNSKVLCLLDEETIAQLRIQNCPLDSTVFKTQLLIF